MILALEAPTPTKSNHLADVFLDLVAAFNPPERLSVAQAAERYRYLNNRGAYQGPWFNNKTPYMVEPMEAESSRRYRAVVMCAAAQSAKTDGLIVNLTLYNAIVDPMDMIIYCPTNAAARDFSTRRIDRMHRDSPEAGAKLLPQKDADNKFDKQYTSGTMLSLSWPSVTEFAGRPIGRVALTDYDRMPDDIDGEGSPFDLAEKRTTSFMSFALTVAESSPSRPVTDPNWIRKSEHEAPPTLGILSLYNRGDRRQFYWPCPACGEFFRGNFRMLKWDNLGNFEDAADTVRMVCPSCSHEIPPDAKYSLMQKGRWLKDGQTINKAGKIHGEGPRSSIASFWLNGVVAAFMPWQRLVVNYLNAMQDYDRTGDEGSLTKFYNNDLSEPYTSKLQDNLRIPEVLKTRTEQYEQATVPPEVRFLVAAVDVQTNSFVVQVSGFAPGQPHDLYVIDRFVINKSERFDAEGDRYMVRPGTYLQDWDFIDELVMQRQYPLADDPDRGMAIKITVCDSGGRAGVTTNAYNFYRKMKREGKAGRFHLVKGHGSASAQRAHIVFPDSNRKDRFAAARGDVPVLMLQSNMLKDALAGRLESITPGRGMIHWGEGSDDEFFRELCAEVRNEKGWENPSGKRNEAWDLSYYTIGAGISTLLRVETIDWDRPPSWAAPQGKNTLVGRIDAPEQLANPKATAYDFAQLGEGLA